MSVAERVYWDDYYRLQRGTRDYPSPDPILFEYVPPLFETRPHRALDLACGVGQNGLWMATQGYTVDALDISRVALAVAQVQAAKRHISGINLIPSDLDDAVLERDTYDVVVIVRFIKRGLMPDIRAAVRPGGRVIYQAFNTQHLNTEPDYNPEQLLRVGELTGYFADWNLLHKANMGGISQLVAVKPE